MKGTRACERCAFYHCALEDDPLGECRRNAPAAVPLEHDDNACYASWPSVDPKSDWCGEFSPKEA